LTPTLHPTITYSTSSFLISFAFFLFIDGVCLFGVFSCLDLVGATVQMSPTVKKQVKLWSVIDLLEFGDG
jgi:hypothetical protein